jgi:Tfp pilus assembly protein PilN
MKNMINLLPLSEKQNLSEERQLKITLISGVVLLFFFTALVLVLAAVDLSVYSQAQAEKTLLSYKEEEFSKTGAQDFKEEITNMNSTLNFLNSFYETKIDMIGFIEKIAKLLPEGVYLESLSVFADLKDESSFLVSLSGRAPTIDDVINLNDNLKNNSQVSQVSFPSDTWLGKEDIIFNVTFLLTKK